jgi:hypothetical protein
MVRVAFRAAVDRWDLFVEIADGNEAELGQRSIGIDHGDGYMQG